MRPLRFRIVALTAAYALALHLLLLAFAVVTPIDTGLHSAGLCATFGSDPNGAPPGSRDTSCAMACAMLGGEMAAPAQPVVAMAVPILTAVLQPAIDQAPPRSAVDGLPRARAPPHA